MTDPTPSDRADEIVAYWARENPDLDSTTKSLAIRVGRLWHHLQRAFREDLHDLDMDTSEVEVLLALRRAPEQRASAGQLLRASQVTSGAITNRVARLEQRGWAARDVDEHDRRQVIVSLTAAGLGAADRVIAAKAKAELRVFAGVDRSLCERLSADLRTLLVSLEGPAPGCDDPGGVAPCLELPEPRRAND